jgi:hypothetical protein
MAKFEKYEDNMIEVTSDLCVSGEQLCTVEKYRRMYIINVGSEHIILTKKEIKRLFQEVLLLHE